MTAFNALVVPVGLEPAIKRVEISHYTQIRDIVGDFDAVTVDIVDWAVNMTKDQGVPEGLIDTLWPMISDGTYRSTCWVNDMGSYNLELNGRMSFMFSYPLYGTVLLSGPADAQGVTQSIHPYLANSILGADISSRARTTRAAAPYN